MGKTAYAVAEKTSERALRVTAFIEEREGTVELLALSLVLRGVAGTTRWVSS